MKISGTFEAFKEFVTHLPTRGHAIFLYQVGPPGNTVITKILVEDREWTFAPTTERPPKEWVREFKGAAIEVDSWTL